MEMSDNSIVAIERKRCDCNELMKKTKSELKRVFTWTILKRILYGQGLSLLICGTAVTSNYLSEKKISIPLTQSLINYLLLFTAYTTTLCWQKDEETRRAKIFTVLRKHWWKYILLSIVDVEANFLVVLAYQYTSLISVQLLDCFILPVVMLLSYFLLKIRYIIVHYIGVVVALTGVACMVGADVMLGKSGEPGSNPALGDVLVLGGAVLYGISNVSMEFIAKRHNGGNIEILGMYGLFCPIVCGIQLAIVERKDLAAVDWTPTVVVLLVGFGVCMFLLYSLLPIVMRLSSATAVNISLLTADLYALFAGLFLFNDKLSPLYIVSFITIVVALLVYNSRQPISRTSSNHNSQSSSLDSLPRQISGEESPLTVPTGTWFSKSAPDES